MSSPVAASETGSIRLSPRWCAPEQNGSKRADYQRALARASRDAAIA